jgi:hypothetical protein
MPEIRSSNHLSSRLLPTRLHAIILVAVAAIVLALPLLFHGPMQQGHDTYEHVTFCQHFSEQFWRGNLYPRWLIGMNFGLGSPSFFVYPPLPSYVFSLLQPTAELFHFDPFRVGEFLALLSSGISAFLWMSTMSSRGTAVLLAVLYMLMPYHLAIDTFRRTALSECWAFAWMPLVLYFSSMVMQKRLAWMLGLPVAFALLILSHLVSVFIFSSVPLAGAALLQKKGERFASVVRVSAGMTLGAGLSSFYLVSALSYAKYFPVRRLGLWYSLSSNLISAHRIFDRSADPFLRIVSLAGFDMALLCLVCCAVVLANDRVARKREIVFWTAVAIIPIFLMHSESSRLWEKVPLLFAAVQFPWRLNILSCLAALPITSMFIKAMMQFRWRARAIALIVYVTCLMPWLLSVKEIWSSYEAQATPPRPLVLEDDGWFAAWSTTGLNKSRAISASDGPRARFISGDGHVNGVLWKPRDIEIDTDGQTGGDLLVNQFYFPEWKAAAGREYPNLIVTPKLPEGLLQVRVPPGPQHVRLQIPMGISEYGGTWISELILILLLGTIAGPYWQRTPE